MGEDAYPLLFVGGHTRAWAPLGPIPAAAVAKAIAATIGLCLLNVMVGGIGLGSVELGCLRGQSRLAINY